MYGARGTTVALCAMALAGSSLVSAPPSQAGTGLSVVCAGPESTTYSPGLTLLPRPAEITARSAYTCTGLAGGPVKASGFTKGVSAGASCAAVNAPQVKESVRYADGRKSVISYTSSWAVRVGGVNVVVLKGRVIEGFAEGAVADRSVQLLPAELPTACLTSRGVRSAAGAGELHIRT
ncbi:hypothetical protein FGW37_31530 [Streptomyces rectiverticillatus]|uniref:hypothetical protein n=1 Tax=Streptomyces rectiverticillatus TaxID=173860 RepID=UPI0015C2EF07|nr:hypothetical protein [Streptomyces rectiverticillatus]QLE75516.1 hypothetical protein FGW37_31530 [Streptomyces rectiverticillatus]